MAKIAISLSEAIEQKRREGTPGDATSRTVARGAGWSVDDVLCTSGPQDRTFEERHSEFSIAIVLAGTFQYRSSTGRALMTPGSLLLGNAGDCFECGHQHATGDRCLAFHFGPDFFAKLAADLEISSSSFRQNRLCPLPELASVTARASAAMDLAPQVSWEELAVELAARALQLNSAHQSASELPVGATARVTRVLRRIEQEGFAQISLNELATEAKLSSYHFLRTFQTLTGLTPHQYLLRSRLREAATRLATGPSKILDVALDCGFGDVSNFNRTFRREFGVSPRQWRRTAFAHQRYTRS